MKMVELLKLAGETLKVMSENDVMRDDWRFVPMYEEFHHMRSMGMKYSEVIRILAEDYCIGRSTVERAIRRLSKECHGLPLDEEPYYNRCALYAAMNMIMSDSSGTIERYVDVDSMFRLVHDLAVDKLKDADGKFNIRTYFGV